MVVENLTNGGGRFFWEQGFPVEVYAFPEQAQEGNEGNTIA